jgi:hypothetical protein
MFQGARLKFERQRALVGAYFSLVPFSSGQGLLLSRQWEGL